MPAEARKVLPARNLPSAVLTTQLESGVTWDAIAQIITLHLCNRGATDRTVTVAVNTGGADTYVLYQYPVVGNDVIALPCLIALAEGGLLKAQADQATSVDLTVVGNSGVALPVTTLAISGVPSVSLSTVFTAGTTWTGDAWLLFFHIANKTSADRWVSLVYNTGTGDTYLLQHYVVPARDFISMSMPLLLASGGVIKMQAEASNALDCIISGYANA